MKGKGVRYPAPTLEEERDFIRSHLDPPNSTLLVAVNGGEIIGLVGLTGGVLEEERHVGTFGLSVAEEHRGKGVGTALIEALVAWAPSAGISRIQAWVWANNPGAIALYQRLGFAQEGVSRNAILSEGQYIDAVLMARLLT